ncbi:head-tail adaptor protein [Pediococcus ethanolidurans]|nr:head-tail adaptor protein [Pediococcus ethanolidurans]
MIRMKSINYSRLTLRIQFGSMGDTNQINPNTGEAIQGFVKQVTVWGGRWSLNVTQQLTLAGQGITNLSMFFIRHNPEIELFTHLKVGNDVYKITNNNVDDGSQNNGYDLITCEKVVASHE